MAIKCFLLLGADSDVACRYVFPALAELEESNRLSHEFVVLGVTKKTWDDPGQFRHHIQARVGERRTTTNLSALRKLLARVNQITADLLDVRQFKDVVRSIRDPVVLYFGLPPAVSEAVAGHLHELGLSPESRIMLEKPFAHDLPSARAMNRILHKIFPEETIYRLDHFLAKQTVQNILGVRFANRVLESVWNRHHVEKIEIIWEETLALEGRASYYDTAGALKDMIQNHLLQLMCLLAMEPPSVITERSLRDRKTELLRSIRSFRAEDIVKHTIRARYTAGCIGDRTTVAYAEEPRVDPMRQTETFAEVRLFVDNQRWEGVPFVLRTGKALAEDRQGISVYFKPSGHSAFVSSQAMRPNQLRMRLKPDRVGLIVNVNGPGNPLEAEPVEMETELAPDPMSPYASLIMDVLDGSLMFFIRDDEAEEAWRIIDPIVEAWKGNVVPLQEYQAGSSGPTPL